jgi:hypothetical protein
VAAETLRRAGWYERTSQACAVFLPVRSVGVAGDDRVGVRGCPKRVCHGLQSIRNPGNQIETGKDPNRTYANESEPPGRILR